MNAESVAPRRATDDTLPPGALFGRYEVVRRLGRGGAGSVYEARHMDLQKPVALKTLHAEYARDARMRERFLFEGKATSRLRHPHVVDVSDYGVQDGAAFLVMEYLEGEDLASHIHREGPLPVERIVELLVPICAAVSAAHEAGIVHRDLKPENIFLARNALGQVQPKVLDFGISKVIGPRDDPRDKSSDLIGTPYYMSPEQAQGASDADARSDQYALGVILYECATGRLPFDATALYALLQQISRAAYPPPRALRPELPARFERVILRAMHPSPARRYPSVLALARDLLAFAPTLSRSTWEPLLAPSLSRFDDPMGEDPTSTFVSPLRLSGVALRAPAPSLSDTLSPSPRAITAPTPKASAPRPARSSRGTWVVAVSALCTMLAVWGTVHLRRTCRAPVARAAVSARVVARPPPATVALPLAPAVVAAPPAVAAPAAPAASVARGDEPTDRGARPTRAGRHHRQRKSGAAGVEG